MSDGKQLALDTDWITAVLAMFSLMALLGFITLSAWRVVAGKPSAMHVPTISATAAFVVVGALWFVFKPSSSTLPRVVRIFVVIWAAQFAVHVFLVLVRISTKTWVLLSPFENWLDIILTVLAFIYLGGWVKRIIIWDGNVPDGEGRHS